MDRIRVGMAAFLMSEAIFFLMLVLTFVWFHGESYAAAKQYLDLKKAFILTGLLLTSSVTNQLSVWGMQKGNQRTMRWWLGATWLLGATFLAVQGTEWADLFEHDVFPSSGPFGSTFFTLTGFHALHVSSGLVALFAFFVLSHAGRLKDAHSLSFEAASWYWHFVDAVWIVILSVVYLWTLA